MFWFIIFLIICTIGALCLKSKNGGIREGGLITICVASALYALVAGVVTGIVYYDAIKVENMIERIEIRGRDKFPTETLGEFISNAENTCAVVRNPFVPVLPLFKPDCRLTEALNAISED